MLRMSGRSVLLTAFSVALASMSPVTAAPVPAGDQEIFFRSPSSRGMEIRVSARNGSNASILASFRGAINFDVGPADSGVIAVSSSNGLQLLRYAKSGGKFIRTALETLPNSGVTRNVALDLSPDGSRIAYRAGDGTKLMVYTIASKTTEEWSSGPWVWDLTWARSGSSVILLEQRSPSDTRSHLYEVTGPGQRMELLNLRYMDRIEISRSDSSLLLLSYSGEDGSRALIGTWRLPANTSGGGWVNADLLGQSVANRGVFSCDDSYLIYGSATKAGAQVWYTRSLPLGADQLIAKAGANAEPQSWSECPGNTVTNSAFEFREVR